MAEEWEQGVAGASLGMGEQAPIGAIEVRVWVSVNYACIFFVSIDLANRCASEEASIVARVRACV